MDWFLGKFVFHNLKVKASPFKMATTKFFILAETPSLLPPPPSPPWPEARTLGELFKGMNHKPRKGQKV